MATKKDETGKAKRAAARQARTTARSKKVVARKSSSVARSQKRVDTYAARIKKKKSTAKTKKAGTVAVTRYGSVSTRTKNIAPSVAARKVTKKSKRFNTGGPSENKYLETKKERKEGPVPVTRTMRAGRAGAMYKTRGVSRKKATKITERSTKRGYATRRYVGSKPTSTQEAYKYQLERQGAKRAKRTKRNTTRGGSMNLKTHPTRVGTHIKKATRRIGATIKKVTKRRKK